jgi:hypothetical protein
MHEWVHICNDVDSLQVVAFGIHIHSSMGEKCTIFVTRNICNVWLCIHL